VHLRLRDPDLQKLSELDVFAGPSARYCPAGVYEWISEPNAGPRYVINAANCVHCKTCDIKDPNQTSIGRSRRERGTQLSEHVVVTSF
jgi:Electron transfer flavoprotein-ubiquinone oxidoreductase.